MKPVVIHTFGDSVLDCGRYNPAHVTPAGLLVRNNNVMFPEWRGKDLATLNGGWAFVDHRATDGATADDLSGQLTSLDMGPDGFETHIGVLSIGGNDLLTYLNPVVEAKSKDTYTELVAQFHNNISSFLRTVSRFMPMLVLNVYDPSFGDNTSNFLGLPEEVITLIAPEFRRRHGDVNALISANLPTNAQLVDMHAHFLTGDPSWYAHRIEPSEVGASEVRRLLYDRITPDLFGRHV